MKNIILTILISLVIILCSSASACTFFTASDNDNVLTGNNEDWYDSNTYIWFHPAEDDKFGRVYVGYANFFPQGGMNDQGLAFDYMATPYLSVTRGQDKPIANFNLMDLCMETCTTVSEILEVFDSWNLHEYHMERYQIMVVDRYGDSAIIEGDIVIQKEGSYQVCTNFYQSNPDVGWYPCWRYDTAENMLENMAELSVEYFSNICNAVHQEGNYPTQYSNIFDLKKGLIYLYHFHDYDHLKIFNLGEELELGEHYYHIPSLLYNDSFSPRKPTILSGPTTGKIGNLYTYTASTIDLNGDNISYGWDWNGDKKADIWTDFFESSEICTVSHSWNQEGTYLIYVKAMDEYGFKSDWSDPLPVIIPKKRLLLRFPLFQWFLEQHPRLFTMLRQPL